MADDHIASVVAPRLGGRLAVILFVFTLLAFVAESQLTQYVQTTLGFRQPYFLFYVVHSSFFILFPLHLLYLVASTGHSPYNFVTGLLATLETQLSSSLRSRNTVLPPFAPSPSLIHQFLRLVLFLTIGITAPSLLWFVAVTLASISDVTALWNTNAFFAYVFTVKMFNLKWEARRLLAVVAATLGAAAVVYGGSTSSSTLEPDLPPDTAQRTLVTMKPSAPLLGDFLTLIASIGYGLYQVLYKKYAAIPSIPSDPEAELPRGYSGVPVPYESIPDIEEGEVRSAPDILVAEGSIYPPPFGLYPNLLTSAIGICTFTIFWIPIPILHFLGLETFTLPPNLLTTFVIFCIAMTGVMFNCGFMILLGIWGPVVTSVGSLLTIVLVFISDVLFGGAADTITVWSLVGSSIIVAGFGVLVYDIVKGRQE